MRNVTHRLVCLNYWSPDGGAAGKVVKAFGNVALLEKIF